MFLTYVTFLVQTTCFLGVQLMSRRRVKMKGASVCLCQLWIHIFLCGQLSESGLIINMTHAEVFPGCWELNASVGWVIVALTRKSSISLLVLPLCLWEWCEAPSHVLKTQCLRRWDTMAAWKVTFCHKVLNENVKTNWFIVLYCKVYTFKHIFMANILSFHRNKNPESRRFLHTGTMKGVTLEKKGSQLWHHKGHSSFSQVRDKTYTHVFAPSSETTQFSFLAVKAGIWGSTFFLKASCKEC